MTQEEFSKKIGASQQYISAIVNGKRNVGPNITKKIKNAFPDFDEYWFITGDRVDSGDSEKMDKHYGQKLAKRILAQKPGRAEAFPVDFTEMSVMYVPLVSKYAYAGYLGGFGDEEYMGDLPKIPFANGFKPKGRYLCFEVRGDSMTADSRESIEEGDIVLAREVRQEYWKSKLHINQWDFVIVHREEGILVKRIAEHDVASGILTLRSLNDYYEDFQVHLGDVAQIFNIVEITKKPRR